MLRDTWLIFKRELSKSARNPAWIGIGIMQPILYLVFFGPLMEKIVANTPGFPPGGTWQILTPALLMQLSLFTMMAGFGVLIDLRTGVIERLRVTPVSRLALLMGRVLVVAVQTVVQAVLIVVIAVLGFGLRAPFGGIVLCLLMVAMLAVTLASCSYALALILKSEQSFPALLNAIMLPLLLLSGILIPITSGLAPSWLYHLSQVNPLRHVMDAQRASFRGDFSADGILTGSVVLLVIMVLAVWWGAHTFKKENA
ncbi:MAG: ABC transporter permease [Sciscionella sp.]|nr:ABC transporter permease [Sciscionella sp.]